MLWSFSTEVTESTDWHEHSMFQLILCRDGKGSMWTENNEVVFSAARTILIPPATLHRFVIQTADIGRLKIVCFPPKDLPRFLSPLHITMLDGLTRVGVSTADHGGHEQWMYQLADSVTDGFGTDDLWAQRVQWGIVSLMLTLHAKEQQAASRYPYLRHKAKINEIVSWIEDNLSEEITIPKLSDQFGMSRSLLTREFRMQTGKSLVEYCNARRVQKAAIALATSELTVAGIAMANGFSNLSYFHRQFKSHFGITPAVFRRKLLEEGSP